MGIGHKRKAFHRIPPEKRTPAQAMEARIYNLDLARREFDQLSKHPEIAKITGSPVEFWAACAVDAKKAVKALRRAACNNLSRFSRMKVSELIGTESPVQV